MIMFVPETDPKPQFHCHAGVSTIRYCSQNLAGTDDNLEKFYGNKTHLSCNMHCRMKPTMWDIVCENWLRNTQSNCAANSSKTWLDFGTYISTGDILEESNGAGNGRCLSFIIPLDLGTVDSTNVTLYCPKDKEMFQSSCRMDCSNGTYLNGQLLESKLLNTRSAVSKPEFWYLFSMLALSWAGMAVVVSIGDAICFGILGDRHHLYGRQRLCGSLGWGIFALLSGLLVDVMSEEGSSEKNYTIVFWMTLVIMGFDMLTSTKLKVRGSPNRCQSEVTKSLFYCSTPRLTCRRTY